MPKEIINVEVDEATVVSWIIMAVLTLAAILLTRNLKVDGKISKFPKSRIQSDSGFIISSSKLIGATIATGFAKDFK